MQTIEPRLGADDGFQPRTDEAREVHPAAVPPPGDQSAAPIREHLLDPMANTLRRRTQGVSIEIDEIGGKIKESAPIGERIGLVGGATFCKGEQVPRG